MRQAQFLGLLGRDAEVRYTNNGTAVCNVPLGVNAGFGDKQYTIRLDCSMLGQRAQGQLPTYLTKGTAVAVSGEVDLRVWNKQDGSPGGAIRLNVGQLSFAGGGASSGGGQQQNQGQQQRPPQQQTQNQSQPQNQGQQQGSEPVDDFDDSIPF